MSVFSHIAGRRPSRSVFNLSYTKKFTADMGKLYPVMVDEVVPGDHFRIGSRCIVRALPLESPVMHDVKVKAEYFFVPYRLLWDDWEDFITRGVDGDQTLEIPRTALTAANTAVGSLYDYLGFPTPTHGMPVVTQWSGTMRSDSNPMCFPVRAYNKIWNDFYRDQNLQSELDVDNSILLTRAWKKDYFTSALPWQQRGTPSAIPLSGLLYVNYPYGAVDADVNIHDAAGNQVSFAYTTANTDMGNPVNPISLQTGSSPAGMPISFDPDSRLKARFNPMDWSANVDLADGAQTFTPNDLRLAFQIQRWQERNSRAGVRYTEFLGAHFGVNPKDDRLQRPEFIGSFTQPLLFSEVLQTSETATTPQGTLAGHGISVDSGTVGSYYVQEFGLIMGLFSIVPRADYQQGINRQWMRRTPFDFAFPEFVNLSEQAVYNHEVYVGNTPDDDLIFGYQGRFNEMRYKPNMIAGLMRTDLSFWHLGRQFATRPNLNSDFITCSPRKNIFAVPSQPGFVVDYANLIRAVRPIPIVAEPGLIDHG